MDNQNLNQRSEHRIPESGNWQKQNILWYVWFIINQPIYQFFTLLKTEALKYFIAFAS